jgi:hypothetical protein
LSQLAFTKCLLKHRQAIPEIANRTRAQILRFLFSQKTLYRISDGQGTRRWLMLIFRQSGSVGQG